MLRRQINVENNFSFRPKTKKGFSIKDRKRGKLFKLTSAEGKIIKVWGCVAFPKDLEMLRERKLMGSHIQRLETVEVIEFMNEKKTAFLLTQDLAISSKDQSHIYLQSVH